MKYSYLSFFYFFPILFFVTACSPISVDTAYNPSTDFKSLKTYRWADIESSEDRLESYPELKNMVHESIDLVLRLKGMQLKPSGDVDFTVTAYAGIKQAMRLRKTGRVPDQSWLGPAGVYDYSQAGKATLFIDIFDGGTGKLVWRGNGIGFIKNYSRGKKMRQNINTWAAEILKSFPPG